MLDDATMITAGIDQVGAVVLSTVITLNQPRSRITSARLRATAHGIYEIRIGGQPVSDAVLAPGWTAYEWRLQVQEHEMTALVDDGAEIEVLLGNGWWRGDLGFREPGVNYGVEIGFLGELEITYLDGTGQSIVTGAGWTARRSDVVANNLYHGQRIDARLRGVVDPLPVRTVEVDRATLVPRVKPVVTRQETFRPARIWSSPSGKTLVDFGQNLVGWVRLRASGEAGSEITVRHAEVLENQELGTRPLRRARATDNFVLSGGDDRFEPTLTFHGFRYAEITGYPGELTADDVEAVVVHSAMTSTGTFACSNDLVNQLVHNSIWSQKGNFLDIPTDCPQRDERLGWTGDIAVYAPTACYQFDVADFLHGWQLDLAAETRHSGFVPYVVPDVLRKAEIASLMDQQPMGPTAVWGDAAVWVPWALWEAYGDPDRLAAHYPAMVMHLSSVEARLSETGLWDQGFQFGDWLDPTAPPENALAARADKGVVATASLYRSAVLTAQVAEIVGERADARRWTALAERTRSSFNAHYIEADGRIRSDCATVYALAIHFGLLDEPTRARAARRLVELVEEHDYRVSTGFAGTPFVTWALSGTGYVETAYRLLLETACPSWLYPVTMEATTIWERWDSMLPDGSINPGQMTSFNHYALGSVADWLYKVVVGIRPGAPGYTRLWLQPTPGPGLDWARGSLDTRHGRVECGWRRDGDVVDVTAVVPDGIAAEIVLPDGSRRAVVGGTHELRVRAGGAAQP